MSGYRTGRPARRRLERAPDARAAFVAEACRDDSGLRGEVESLLAAHERAGTFLDAPLSPAAVARIVSELAASAHKLHPGDRLGPYEVVDALGAGGARCIARGIPS